MKKEIKPLPFPIYFWTVFTLAVSGLIDSAYLAISHYRVYTDIGYRSFCSISKSLNCDTVSQSPYSILLELPVPIWGVIGYLFFIGVLFFACTRDSQKIRIWAVLFALSLIFSIYSVVLAFISAFYIHSYCFMCVVIYGINFLLVFYTWLIQKRFGERASIYRLKKDIKHLWDRKARGIPLVSAFVIGAILLILFMPSYWHLTPPKLSGDINTGYTEDGHPWMGAENPEIEIMEFTDYMCFQCKKMHFYLRQLILQYPDKIRIIHRHFPMDHRFNPLVKEPFHVGTGGMALFAIYAAKKEKFWEMNDILFSIKRDTKRIDLKKIARQTGLEFKALANSMNDQELKYALYLDIVYGLKKGVVGTPSYIIDGQVYRGQIPAEVLNRVID